MGIAQDGGTKFFPAGWNVEAKPCDYCKSAAALLFCRNDSAFMCIACDAKVHNSNNKLTHARVWMCEVCEQAPASVTCKADAASLCVACDRDIHSANPLARRHHRIAVVPFYNASESILMKSTNEPISDSSVTTNAFDVPVNDRETGVQND
ncbi:B-box zinc finger protein, partial [Acinetobacter baumannii]